MTSNFDHLVIASASLDEGVAYVKDKLGVDIPVGGEHPLMGTHNHVMKLSDTTFLEVIAINPDAALPKHPRWFGLDDPSVRANLAQGPKLLTWVVNTNDVEAVTQSAAFDFGTPYPLKRGDLRWLFSLTDDGRLLGGGIIPHVMQWQTTPHPACNMADKGCRLKKLEIHHPYPDWLRGVLSQIGMEEQVDIIELKNGGAPCLKAVIDTPSGMKTL